MQFRPYLIVPKLIPQPTWGGDYIVNHKDLKEPLLQQIKIGQSYELATDSLLSTATNSKDLPIEIADAKDGKTVQMFGVRNSQLTLQSLIDEDPREILGEKAISLYGNKMNILIKFTQAKGNSFQVHVEEKNQFGHWKPKPESWYFFEKGKATLGLKKNVNLREYKEVCKRIEQEALNLSKQVKEKVLDIDSARKNLVRFVNAQDPFQFVNVLLVPKDTIIDLSAGGTHHSWEEGDDIPEGNILYEVQVNVMDNDCTIRSFDKGKLADDGAIRPIHVDDYFRALNSDPSRNEPEKVTRLATSKIHSGISISNLFNSPYYSADLLQFEGMYQGEATHTHGRTFHHLFIREGNVDLLSDQETITLNQGASAFVPAKMGEYKLRSDGEVQIIKTWV